MYLPREIRQLCLVEKTRQARREAFESARTKLAPKIEKMKSHQINWRHDWNTGYDIMQIDLPDYFIEYHYQLVSWWYRMRNKNTGKSQTTFLWDWLVGSEDLVLNWSSIPHQ